MLAFKLSQYNATTLMPLAHLNERDNTGNGMNIGVLEECYECVIGNNLGNKNEPEGQVLDLKPNSVWVVDTQPHAMCL